MLLPYVPVWLMVLFRLTGIFVLAPVLGSQTIPRLVKVFLAIGLSFAVWPMLWSDPQAAANMAPAIGELNFWTLGTLVGYELLIGYVIGFAVSLPLIGMQLGGHMIDQQMGLAVGGIFNPESGGDSAAVGQLLFMLALAIFVAAGGLDVMLTILAETFRTIPLGGMTDFGGLLYMMVGLVTITFELALRVAAPLLCLMFLVSVGMGFIMRTVPQFNILSVGFSIRILASVVLLIASLGAVVGAYEGITDRTLRTVQAFFAPAVADEPSESSLPPME